MKSTLDTRLVVGFLAVSFLVLIMGGFGYWAIDALRNTNSRLQQEDKELIGLEEIRGDFLLQLYELDDYIKSRDEGRVAAYFEVENAIEQNIRYAQERAQTSEDIDYIRILGELSGEIERINKISSRIIGLMGEDKIEEARWVKSVELESEIRRAHILLTSIVRIDILDLAYERQGFFDEAQQFQFILMGSIIATFVASVVIGFFSSRAVTRSIMRAEAAREKSRLAERIAQKNTQRLREVDKMKDEFLNITAHELKGPLMPVSVQLQLLLEGAFGTVSHDQKSSLEMIFRNINALNKLVSDLLDVTKIKSRKLQLAKENVVLEKIIREEIGDFASLAKDRGITISTKISSLPKIQADSGRIAQVFTNLLDNALKFTSGGGNVIISAEVRKDDIVVSIADSGVGISESNLKKLFTAFFQIDTSITRQRGGTGLGLVISRGIIEAHGGKMWAQSPGENKGSTFSFTLPI